MANGIDDMDPKDDTGTLLSRRAVLKMMAGAPLVVTFGLAASPLVRYLKPSMKPGNFIQSADLPTADQSTRFHRTDFPEIWTCLPFMAPIKYLVFNPEEYEIRKIPSFIIRTGKNEMVAYSRRCPNQSDHILNFVIPTADGSCGCPDVSCKGLCIGYSKTPILSCPCDGSIFDLTNDGRVACGPAPRPPRQFTLDFDGEFYRINGWEHTGIA